MQMSEYTASVEQQWVCEWLLRPVVIFAIQCGMEQKPPMPWCSQLDILNNVEANTRSQQSAIVLSDPAQAKKLYHISGLCGG